MLIIGDWAPGNKQVRFSNDSNIALCNLEGPLLPCNHSLGKLPKAGPSLFSCHLPSGNNQFIFSLANNHIMDYGLHGLDATIKSIDKNGFKSCGAGNNIDDARKPIIIDDKDIHVGIIACCEAQFGVARQASAGVAEFGPWIYRAIDDLRKNVDAIVVSCHAAVEDSPWPSPYLRELYRSFIDAGAKVVHGHHSHIPQGYEPYGDGMIFYGLGNFAVDPDKWHNYPNAVWSLAVEIDFNSHPAHWRELTFEIRNQPGSDETIMIEESTAAEQEIHRHYLTLCNQPFTNPEFFEALWQEIALRAYFNYGSEYMGIAASQNGWFTQSRVVLTRLKSLFFNGIAPLRHRPKDYLLWYHMIACESHRQMLRTSLGVLSGEIKDLRTEETRQLAEEMMPYAYKQ